MPGVSKGGAGIFIAVSTQTEGIRGELRAYRCLSRHTAPRRSRRSGFLFVLLLPREPVR